MEPIEHGMLRKRRIVSLEGLVIGKEIGPSAGTMKSRVLKLNVLPVSHLRRISNHPSIGLEIQGRKARIGEKRDIPQFSSEIESR